MGCTGDISTPEVIIRGRTEEARPALEEFRRLRPNDTITSWRRNGPRQSPYPLFLATRERQFAAIRAIGRMPEE
jgi:hypothetical protein